MIKQKRILTAAITGAVHTPSMSPYLPITPDQIVEDAVKAAQAGASVVHIHGRDPVDGKPSPDLGIMEDIVSRIKKQSDVVICITTGAALWMSLEQRLAPVSLLKPELASCNAGSINFVMAAAAKRLDQPKYDWEVPYLESTNDLIFSNTFKGLEYYIRTMNEMGTRPEFEVYDVGMINNLAHFAKMGVIKQPMYIQFVMGILGGIPATVDHLVYMVRTAKEQLGDFTWSCAAAGRSQFPLVTAALTMGGHARVGLEDNLNISPGVFAKSSAEQVTKMREIMDRLSIELATPDEAREILTLKGKDKVVF